MARKYINVICIFFSKQTGKIMYKFGFISNMVTSDKMDYFCMFVSFTRTAFFF